MTAQITVQLDDGLSVELDELAAKTARFRDWLIERAIETYVSVQTWQVAEIMEGIAAADRGDLATDKEMEAVFAKYTAHR